MSGVAKEGFPLVTTAWLPPVQWWAHGVAAGGLVIDAHEHYAKRSWRNRAHLAGPNGLMRCSIPLVKGKNQQLPIREVRIAWQPDWSRTAWKAIRSAYGRAPYFAHYGPEVEALFAERHDWLFDYNLMWIEAIAAWLGLELEVRLSERWHPIAEEKVRDLRPLLSPKVPLEADQRFVPVAYPQVFAERHGFLPNLSILDLLFCCGPETPLLLRRCVRST